MKNRAANGRLPTTLVPNSMKNGRNREAESEVNHGAAYGEIPADVQADRIAFEIFARIEAQEIEAMPIEDVEAELREAGIDPDAAVKRIRARISNR